MGVFAVKREESEGRIRYRRAGATAFTDDQGRYRLHSLPPGAYAVAVAPMGEVASSGQQGVVYYPGHGDASRAEFLDLAPGADLSSIDFRVAPQQPGTVAGSVAGIPREWSGGRAAVALTPPSGIRIPVAYAVTDAAGRYWIEGVPAGDYQALAWGPLSNSGYEDPPQGAQVRYASGAISVRGGELAAFDFALAPAIRVESRWAAKGTCAGVESLRIRLDGGWFDFWTFEGQRSKDGIVWDNLPAGTYRFGMPDLDGGCTFEGVRTATAETPREMISVSTPVQVLASVVASSGELAGKVESKGAAVRGASVMLFADDERTLAEEAVTNGEGMFRFDRLPAGKYVIWTSEPAKPDGAADASEVEPRIQRLTLERGQRVEIKVDLTRE